MSIKICPQHTDICVTEPLEVEVDGAVSICPEEATTEVLARKKEYSIVGDAVYVSMNPDELPPWLQSLVDILVTNALGNNSALLGDARSSLLLALTEIEVAKNAYTDAILTQETIDGIILAHLSALNATYQSTVSEVRRLDTVIAAATQSLASTQEIIRAQVRDDISADITRQSIAYTQLNHKVDTNASEAKTNRLAIIDSFAAELLMLRAENDQFLSTVIEQIDTFTTNEYVTAEEFRRFSIEVKMPDGQTEVTADLRENNVVLSSTTLSGVQSLIGYGYTSVTTDEASVAIYTSEARQKLGNTTARTFEHWYSVLGKTQSAIVEMDSKNANDQAMLDEMDTSTPQTQALYDYQADKLSDNIRRKNFLGDVVSDKDENITEQSFGISQEVTTPNGTLVSAYSYTNDGEKVTARFVTDDIYIGRPGQYYLQATKTGTGSTATRRLDFPIKDIGFGIADGNGNYPLSLVNNVLVFDDARYRKVDGVLGNSASATLTGVNTGKSYFYTLTSDHTLNNVTLAAAPTDGFRFDIFVSGGTLTVSKVNNDTMTKTKIKPETGATFVFFTNKWYTVGLVD